MNRTFRLKWLLRGQQSEERVDALLAFTKIESDSKVEAVKDYLVKGRNLSTAAIMNDVDLGNLTRVIDYLEVIEDKYRSVKLLPPEEKKIAMLTFTRIRSKAKLSAIVEHLQNGQKLTRAAANCQVDAGNLRRTLNQLILVEAKFEKLLAIDTKPD